MDNSPVLDSKFADTITEWFIVNKRDLPFRQDHDPYRVWISEIMLQQTRVVAVLDHYARFIEELPSVDTLADVPDDKLHKLWEGLGYYTRAKNLKKAAIVVRDEYGGEFPDRYDEIVKLPGIGPYTAGAIASICFDEPIPAVDGNVLRVVTRYLGLYDNIDSNKIIKKMTLLLQDIYTKKNAQMLTEGLMELGALVCLPNGAPKCEACPLRSACIASKCSLQNEIPVKEKKKQRKKEKKTIFLLEYGDKIAIYKRSGEGLLANLYGLPEAPSHLGEQETINFLKKWDVHPLSVSNGKSYRHVFTHVEWDMISYKVSCENTSSRFLWKTKDGIESDYALPTAFRIFLNYA